MAFAIGVAGLVTASVAYYQLSQVLSRPRPPAAENGPAGVPPGAVGPGAVAAPTVTTGRLEVTSDPAGASVTVNGQPKGLTPLALAELSAGRYDVTITRGPATISRSVTVSPGSLTNIAASLALPAPPTAKVSATPSAPAAAPPASTGWVTFGAPLELRILENGRARGTTSSGRVAFSPGVHEVTLVNELYELRETVSVTVAAGRATQVTVPVRMGSLSINALPWSEVWIDGAPVGTTPLANLSVPVGSRLVVWRHPTLGERRQTVVVKARTPARVGVDLNR